MKADILIKGGRVIDPARKMDQIADVLIKGNKIAEATAGEAIEADYVIDAKNCLVMPGLIDFHCHFFSDGTDGGVPPDTAFPPAGVTTAVDGGSAGFSNYGSFHRSVVSQNRIRIKSLLNISPAGLITSKWHENVDPKYYDEARISGIFEKYQGEVIALKVRSSQEIVGGLGLEPLKATIAMAEKIGCPVVVHTTNPPAPMAELVSLLRPGDVFCHVYHCTGNTILGNDGKVLPAVKEARQRGVIFDAANGRNHWGFKVAAAAIADNFLPDIISTDVTIPTMFRPPVMGLPYIMSKYLNMGLHLAAIVSACTEAPARYLKMEGRIGTLMPGAFADVAVFRLADKTVEFSDTRNEKIIGSKILIPQITIGDGRILFRQMDF